MTEKSAGKIITTGKGVSFTVVAASENTIELVIASGQGANILNIDKASAVLIADALSASCGKAASAGEQLYYLKLLNDDNNSNAYVNLRKRYGQVFIADKRTTDAVQTQFTLQEIYSNEKLRKYEHFIVPVK